MKYKKKWIQYQYLEIIRLYNNQKLKKKKNLIRLI